jgi:hypothetical protein
MKCSHLCEKHYPISSVYGQMQPVKFRKSTGYMSLAHANANIASEAYYAMVQQCLTPGQDEAGLDRRYE